MFISHCLNAEVTSYLTTTQIIHIISWTILSVFLTLAINMAQYNYYIYFSTMNIYILLYYDNLRAYYKVICVFKINITTFSSSMLFSFPYWISFFSPPLNISFTPYHMSNYQISTSWLLLSEYTPIFQNFAQCILVSFDLFAHFFPVQESFFTENGGVCS